MKKLKILRYLNKAPVDFVKKKRIEKEDGEYSGKQVLQASKAAKPRKWMDDGCGVVVRTTGVAAHVWSGEPSMSWRPLSPAGKAGRGSMCYRSCMVHVRQKRQESVILK